MVERNEEEVGCLHRLENARRVLALEHGVAERAAHAVEDCGSRQELDLIGREPSKVLRPQVIHHEAVVAGERGQRGGVLGTVEREGGEIEAGRPSLRVLVQGTGLGLGEVDAGGR